ncbi:MAG: chloride channel protein [Bdellovibrionales bacterium]|nr:chloride channel protein [Bdellovibrionales bacterium]
MMRIGLTWLLTVVSVSLFAIGLRLAEEFRFQHEELMLALPLVLLGVMLDRKWPRYHLRSRDAVSAMAAPGESARLLSGPLVVALTWFNHLLGASVGREGVGLQLGAWADQSLAKKFPTTVRQSWFSARLAIATGFAVLFGAPLAGVVFVFESLVNSKQRERIDWREGLVLLLATFLGDTAGRWLGVRHDAYSAWGGLQWTSSSAIRFFLYVAALVMLSALAAVFFTLVQRKMQLMVSRFLAAERVRGIVLLALVLLVIGVVFEMLGGRSPYPGLGLSGMGALAVFENPGLVHPLEQPLVLGFIKILLTAFFVGLGLRGGEVTPLLVSGAALAVGGIHLAYPTSSQAAELSHFALPLGATLIWSTAARRPFTGSVLAVEIFTSGFFDRDVGLALALLALVTVLAHASLLVYDQLIKKMRGVLPDGFHASLYDD